MEFYQRICLLIVLTLLLPTAVDSIDCYSCTSDNDDCKEIPNGAELVINGHVASGCPSCVKEFKGLGTVFSSVKRRCGDSDETSDSCKNVIGYGKCVCTTTFCNHGNTTTTSTSLLILVLSFFSYLYNFM
ncbi:hypothetical protein ACF0H5_018564 [Mactra antiquata]